MKLPAVTQGNSKGSSQPAVSGQVILPIVPYEPTNSKVSEISVANQDVMYNSSRSKMEDDSVNNLEFGK